MEAEAKNELGHWGDEGWLLTHPVLGRYLHVQFTRMIGYVDPRWGAATNGLSTQLSGV